MPTIKDVAAEAGVTSTTVSRVLNNRGYISEETREKSAERKETGDYTLSVTGTDVKSMTQSLVAGSVSISVPDRSSFDIKA